MANGLMGLQDLLGGSSNATSGLFGGQSVFSPAPTRGQQRSRLLSDLISDAGRNPYSRLGAAFGGLIGMGARAGAEGLGVVDEPEEVKRNRAIREVQENIRQRGLDPLDAEFGQVVAEEFNRRGYQDLAASSLLKHRAIRNQFAPEPVETERVVSGDTEIGQQLGLGSGESAIATFVDGRVSGIKDRELAKEDNKTERELERDYYIGQGYDERVANDLAFGNIRTTINPFTKQPELVNISGGPVPDALPEGYVPPTGSSTVATDEQGDPVRTGDEPEEVPPEVRQPRGLVDRPLSVGLVPYLQEGLSRTFGQFFPETLTFAKTTEDRTQLRTATQQLVSSLSISSRPPEFEQQRIVRNLPSLGPLESPERARTQLTQLTSDLLVQRDADLEALEDPNVNPQLKRQIQKRVNSVDRMLRIVDPRALETGEVTKQPDFSFGEAEEVLNNEISQNKLPENAQLGAFDFEKGAYPIIIDDKQATNAAGELLYVLPD